MELPAHRNFFGESGLTSTSANYIANKAKEYVNAFEAQIKGNSVYKVCPRCGEPMKRDDSKVYTSDPPQYGYTCPKCGEVVFDTVSYDNPAHHGESVDRLRTFSPQPKQRWSKNDENFLKEIIDFFENNTVRLQHDLSMYAHWLKSLPERFDVQEQEQEEPADYHAQVPADEPEF